MFLCVDCCKKSNVPELEIMFGPKSYGTCESCEERKTCVDSHNYSFPENEE